MFSAMRNMHRAGVAKSVGMAFIAVLFAGGAAAALDVTINNKANAPVKVSIKKGGQEVGHSDRIEKKSSGKVTVNSGVSVSRCSASNGGTYYAITCDAANEAGASNTAQQVQSLVEQAIAIFEQKFSQSKSQNNAGKQVQH